MAFSLIVSRGCPNYSVNNRIRVKMSLPFAICIVAFLAAGVNGANETTGILTSPGYPDAYTRGTRTTAIELPNPNATVLLQFQKLDLTATGYTSSTFFRIHDGLNTSDRVLNIYSSNEYYTAKDVESTGNKMLIYFSAYHTGAPGSGYYATYSTVDRHDNIILETGSITSPGYPAKNTDAVAIHWTLTQPNSDFVRVEIEDLELNEDSDSLTIRDGPLAGSPILGQLSGVKNQTHHTFLSYRNSTFLRYVSNGLSTGRGFNATFHPGYRYRLTGSASGEVASKNFPSNYSTYLAEEWVINLPAGNMSVLLEFKCFHTDTDDVLTIRDGDSYLSPIIGVYSGNDLPPNILAYNNRLTVSFVSYGGATNKGFYATYRSGRFIFK
ncbi:Cubilin [Folsomia candida]|uniref:Cubilin n=1 Tax=Folsomia candida TaxID=158441 RepID=A0A226EC77_FOLCA|nr:Cubilin [Folsomia candida]